MYEPLKVFLVASIPFLLAWILGIARFVYYYVTTDLGHGMIQSLVISWSLITIGISLFSLGVIADLIAKNRFLIEEQLKIAKKNMYDK